MAEVIPYEIRLNDQPFWVVDKLSTRLDVLEQSEEYTPRTLGLIAIGAFRNRSYVDYIALARVDDETADTDWTRVYGQYEFLDWMAGTVYRDEARAKELRDIERRLGRFVTQFGWAPDYILETEPNENEFEGFIESVVSTDVVDGELILPPLDD